MITLARQCLKFHELLATLINRELRARYRGSILGSTWMIVQPLLFLAIYYVVFSQFMKSSAPAQVLEDRPGWFALAMFCGLIPWISFVDCVSRGAGCVIENGNLIKKFAFPSEILPAYLVGVALVNAMVGFAILAVAVFVLHGEAPHHAWIIPILLVLQGVFTLGLTYLLSALTVFVRDIGHMLPMLMNFWFFLTPVFFFGRFNRQPLLIEVYRWNPMSYLIEAWRYVFIYHPKDLEAINRAAEPRDPRSAPRSSSLPPGAIPWADIGIFAAVAFLLLLAGYRTFLRLKPGFADEV